ncbi:MAG TPA: HEAT repeat domain-containing protein [Planctomycetota bacterium]|nr:HEAT repeat domain-containing protein [Planctomycetota bacterium]
MIPTTPRRARPALACWLGAGLLLAPALVAQSPAAAPGPALAKPSAVDPQDAADAKVRRRLLHARGGGVLRADSRRVDGRWEYRRAGDKDWTTLPAGLVESARLESAALDELHSKRAALGRATPAGLTGLSEWALGEGLYDEALGLLDDVLADDPDQPDALALLHRDDLPFRIPVATDASAEELLRFAGAAPPALREMAVSRLPAVPDQPALRTALQERLSDRSASTRAMAALALRRLSVAEPYGETEVKELLRRAARDLSPDVRRSAALALRDAHESGLILPLVTALESNSSTARTYAAEALGTMGYDAAVPALVQRLVTLPTAGGSGDYSAPRSSIFVGRQISYVAGYDVEVAQNAAIGKPLVGVIQDGATLDVAVMGVSSTSYVTESATLRASLQKLTGANPGNSVAAWKSWWAANEARFAPDAPATGSGG